MGPCWLQIKHPVIDNKGVSANTGFLRSIFKPSQVSWSKLEATATDPKDINPFPETDVDAPKEVPPLTVMSLSIRTIMNHKENKREVVCASSRTWNNRMLRLTLLVSLYDDDDHYSAN
jgi:DNA polymerase alpha subunit A